MDEPIGQRGLPTFITTATRAAQDAVVQAHHHAAMMSQFYVQPRAGALWLSGAAPEAKVEPAGGISVEALLIVPGGKVEEGMLIEAVSPLWFKILEWMDRDPRALFNLTWRQLEELVAGAYEADGFDEVILTKRSGDGGKDVIATRHGRYSVRIIEQVKRFGPDHVVPTNDVRALLGIMSANKATKACFSTTSTFAPRIMDDPAVSGAIPHWLELYDGPNLQQRLRDIASKKSGG